MKRRILIVNIIIFIVCFAILEIYSYFSILEGAHPLHKDDDVLKYRIPHAYNYQKMKDPFTVIFPKKMKGGIVIFGCSYVEGGGISFEETFANQLAQKTGRIVYRRGRSDSSTSLILKQLNDKNFKLEVPNVEYVIYVYLRYHNQRNLRYHRFLFPSPEPRFKINNRNNVLEEIKPFFSIPFYMFFTVQKIQDFITEIQVDKEKKANEPLLIKYLETIYGKLRQLYPNVKFVFLEYPDGTFSLPPELQYDKDLDNRYLSPEVVKQIKDLGIIYFNAEKLVGHELRDVKLYRHTDLEHPNGKAWDEVSSALIKALDI